MAGRITLAKSVIESIPVYPMMTTQLPISCTQEIQRAQRAFILGEKKIHAVNWHTLKLPKSQGGLGLRDLVLMNDTCLMKVGWGLEEGRGWSMGGCLKREIW